MLERVVCGSMLPVCACIQLKCSVSWVSRAFVCCRIIKLVVQAE